MLLSCGSQIPSQTFRESLLTHDSRHHALRGGPDDLRSPASFETAVYTILDAGDAAVTGALLFTWTWRDLDLFLLDMLNLSHRPQVFELGSPVAAETNLFLTAADAEAMANESVTSADESASSRMSSSGSTMMIVPFLVGLILTSRITG